MLKIKQKKKAKKSKLLAVIEDRPHAILGGSGMYRALNCTGSIFLTKDLPPAPDSEASVEGRIFHDGMEKELREFLSFQETGKHTPIVHSEEFNAEMSDYAAQGIDLLWEKVFEYSVTGKKWGFEEQFWLHKKLQMGGYVDFFMVYIDDHGNRVLVVADWKYGYKHVTAKGNPQLAFYLCAFLEEARKMGKDIDYARAIIFQPRAYGKNAYEEAKFTVKQLDTWREKFFKTAERIFVEKKQIFKVGDWCEWCRANDGHCEAYARHQEKNLSLEMIDVEKIKLPKPRALTMAQRVRIALAATDIAAFVKAVKADVMRSFIDGHDTPGVKVVEGKSHRKWIEKESKVEKHLTKLLRPLDSSPYNAKFKGITQVEKELKSLYDKDEIGELLSPIVTVSEPPTLLVLESDERKAVETNLSNLKGLTHGK